MSAKRLASTEDVGGRCIEVTSQAFALQDGPSSPPVDTVLFWLSRRVEQDFARRGVFPNLRYANANGFQGAATLHFLSPGEAAIVLADAIDRHAPRSGAHALNGSDRRSFAYHITKLRRAIEQAKQRRVEFEAAEPFCRFKSDCIECWAGSKAQLGSLGIHVEGAWPRDPGGARRWAKTWDGRGYPARITASSEMWSGRFEVRIDIPRSAASAPAPNADGQRENSQSPLAVVRFDELTEQLKGFMRGYGSPAEAIDDFASAVAQAREALELGLTTDYSQKQIVHRAALQAKADAPLQAFLARVRKSVSDGDAQ